MWGTDQLQCLITSGESGRIGSKGLRSGLSVLLVISYFFKRRRSEARRLLILVKSEKWVAGVYYYVILCIFLYVWNISLLLKKKSLERNRLASRPMKYEVAWWTELTNLKNASSTMRFLSQGNQEGDKWKADYAQPSIMQGEAAFTNQLRVELRVFVSLSRLPEEEEGTIQVVASNRPGVLGQEVCVHSRRF